MKNMNDKTKKWLVIAGGLMISAVLVVMISTQFEKPPVEEVGIAPNSSESSDVVAKEPNISEKEDDISPLPIEPTIPNEQEPTNGDDKGTEQTIQPDPKPKPTYTDEELKNPDKKPNGDATTENDKVQDHDKVEKPTIPPTNPSGGLPGFDNVPNLGENQGTVVDSDGDINKQVGIMD